jgi:hypothetical protein
VPEVDKGILGDSTHESIFLNIDMPAFAYDVTDRPDSGTRPMWCSNRRGPPLLLSYFDLTYGFLQYLLLCQQANHCSG